MFDWHPLCAMDKWELDERGVGNIGYISILRLLLKAGPHSRVINRQIREVGSVAWMALTNLTTAAASLG